MNKLQHTPGPWKVGVDRVDKNTLVMDDNNIGIASVVEWPNEAEANARLIAAAPRMLEALIGAIEIIKIWHGEEAFQIYLKNAPEMKPIISSIERATGLSIEEVLR